MGQLCNVMLCYGAPSTLTHLLSLTLTLTLTLTLIQLVLQRAARLLPGLPLRLGDEPAAVDARGGE
jgi:hypothetical protein